MPWIHATYAQNNRSTCKGCLKMIQVNAVRLGYTAGEKGKCASEKKIGYAKVSWFHENCFTR